MKVSLCNTCNIIILRGQKRSLLHRIFLCAFAPPGIYRRKEKRINNAVQLIGQNAGKEIQLRRHR